MATEQSANELKQQGALEASRDPGNTVSAEDAENKVLEDSRSAGVAAFKFDPDATPAEKKAQAREVGRCFAIVAPVQSANCLSYTCHRQCPMVFTPIDAKAQLS